MKGLVSLGPKVNSVTSYTMSRTALFGGCLVTADGTNFATITVVDGDGNYLMDFKTTGSGVFMAPVMSSTQGITCTVSGTNAYAQFFEWRN